MALSNWLLLGKAVQGELGGVGGNTQRGLYFAGNEVIAAACGKASDVLSGVCPEQPP